MRARRSRTAHSGWSSTSGRIRAVDYLQERRLVVGGPVRPAHPLDGARPSIAHADMVRSRPVVEAVIPLVKSDATRVSNGRPRGDAGALGGMVPPRFASVGTRRVRPEGEKVLISASRPGRR